MLCVVDVACMGLEPTDIWEPKSQKNGDFVTPISAQLFDAQVEYECGLARKFDWGNGSLTPTLTQTCKFNGSWDNGMVPCICKMNV